MTRCTRVPQKTPSACFGPYHGSGHLQGPDGVYPTLWGRRPGGQSLGAKTSLSLKLKITASNLAHIIQKRDTRGSHSVHLMGWTALEESLGSSNGRSFTKQAPPHRMQYPDHLVCETHNYGSELEEGPASPAHRLCHSQKQKVRG